MILKFTGQFNQSMATHETSIVDNVISIGFNVNQLKGIGTEYLVIKGNVVAKFYDGNIVGQVEACTNETTLVSA